MKSIIISEADQTGFVSIYYVMESPYSSNAEQIIFAQDRSKPDRTSDGGLLLESEWGQLIFEKPQYNRGIQMYRFPNSDVQKSVIFEGIKKRLKIV